MTEISTAVIVLISVYLGYKMGKGEPIVSMPHILKRVIRTEAQEKAVIDKLQRTK